MYAHPAFEVDRSTCLAFAAQRGFGVVSASAAGTVVASPLPFHLAYAADGAPIAVFHVARANPLAALAARGGSWLLVVMGPDAYVSPDWYASPDQVPTWLYQSVQLSGPVRSVSDEALGAHLDALGETFESRLAPKPSWTAEKVAPARIRKLAKAIVAIAMRVESVHGSFKLNQHKSDADHMAVAATLGAQNQAGARAIAEAMVALRPHLHYEPADAAA